MPHRLVPCGHREVQMFIYSGYGSYEVCVFGSTHLPESAFYKINLITNTEHTLLMHIYKTQSELQCPDYSALVSNIQCEASH